MPNRKEHLDVGGIVGTGVAVFCAREQNGSAFVAEAIGGYLGGRFGGMMPDVFDPPTSPNHRSLGHGILSAAGVNVTVFDRMDSWQESCRAFARRHAALGKEAETDDEVIWRLFMEFLDHVGAGMVVGIPAGYVSHLWMDANTKRGLPLVG